MKKLPLVLLMLMMALSARAQMIRGIVKDKNSDVPIAYLSVGIVGTRIGTLTDRSGAFDLTIPDSLRNGKLTLYGLGYERHEVALSSFRSEVRQILMTPLSSNLEEHVVNRKEGAGYTMGEYITAKRKVMERAYRSFSPDNPEHSGTVVAGKVSVDKGHFLHSASVFVADCNTDSLKFRLRLYAVDEATQLPGRDLIQRPIIRDFPKMKGWVELDLEDEYIYLEKGDYFLGFELIEKKEDRYQVYNALQQRKKILQSLHEKGVKGVDKVMFEVNGEQQPRFRTSMSLKKAKKYGLDMPLMNVKFEVVRGKGLGVYRSSSLQNWMKSDLGVFRIKLKYEYETDESGQ